MIITRAPLRISIAGGGTDLPSYYEKFGGITIAAAIDKYVYTILTDIPEREYRLNFIGGGGQNEISSDLGGLYNKYVAAVFRKYGVGPGVSLTSISQVPPGTGLGSSGAFLVSLIKACLVYTGQGYKSIKDIAESAFNIEARVLERPVGKQDQYMASYGGYRTIYYNKDGDVNAGSSNGAPLDYLKLYYTYVRRDSASVLQDQVNRANSVAIEDNLHRIKDLATQVLPLPEHLQRHWSIKKERSTNMSSDQFDRIYYVAMKNGAQGGKLVGAGAGGFFLFYTTAHEHLSKAMRELGLVELPFRIDYDGVTLIEDTNEYTKLYKRD